MVEKLIPINYKERWEKVRNSMAKKGLSAIIAYGNTKIIGNALYLADYLPRFGGYESIGGRDHVLFGSCSILFPLESEPVLLTDLGWDVLRAQEESQMPDTRHSNDFGGDLAKIIKDRNIRGVVDIEPWPIFPAMAFQSLTGMCSNTIFGPTRLIESVRRIKEPAEIQRLREAERITEMGVKAGMEAIAEGVSEHEITNAVESTLRKYGDLLLGGNSIVGTGTHTWSGAVSPKKDIFVKRGDIVQFDVCGRYENYAGDVSRVAALDEPNKDVKKLYDAVLDMNNQLREAVKPGAIPAELHKLAHQVAKNHGFDDENLTSLTGHGVGLDIHEPPDYGKDETPLEKNMLITVEPCLVWKDVAGIRIEDLLLLTEEGNESLSKSSRELVLK